jgi:probable rRNA maturation factor
MKNSTKCAPPKRTASRSERAAARAPQAGFALLNLQKSYAVRSAPLAAFVHALKRRLRLGKVEFNVCLVDDAAIRHMNWMYRGKNQATDVLSFPWMETAEAGSRAVSAARSAARPGITNFLGDVVISVETARYNARAEGHSLRNEIRWLILHGVLHLLGYDHERDRGEMVSLELALRDQLGVGGRRNSRPVCEIPLAGSERPQ